MSIIKRELLRRERDLDFSVIPDDDTAAKIILGLKSLYEYQRDQVFARSLLEKKFSSVDIYKRGGLFPVQTYISRSLTKVPYKGVEEALIRLFPKQGKGTFYNFASLAAVNGLILLFVYQTFYNLKTKRLEQREVFSLEKGDQSKLANKAIARHEVCPTPYFLFKFGFWYGSEPSYWLPAPTNTDSLQRLIGRSLRGNTPVEVAYDWVYLIGQPFDPMDIGPELDLNMYLRYIVVLRDSVLEFNGTSAYVSGPTNNFPTSAEEGTVEFWFKADSLSRDETLFVYGDSWYADGMLLLRKYSSDNKIHFIVNTAANVNIATDSAVTPGVWYHVAATYKTNEAKLYLNGVQQGVTDTSCSMPTAVGSSWYIGRQNTDTEDYFAGRMNEVRIYERILLQAEIYYNFRHPSTPYDGTGLVGWWPMDEESGETTDDISGNENKGEITDAEWATEIYRTGDQNINPLFQIHGGTEVTEEPAGTCCLYFDGHTAGTDCDYVEVETSADFNFPDDDYEFTIAFDIRGNHSNQTAPSDGIVDIISRPDASNKYLYSVYVEYDDINGTGNFIHLDVDFGGSDLQFTSDEVDILDDEWHTVVIAFQNDKTGASSKTWFFVDGVTYGDPTDSAAGALSSTRSIYVGCFNASAEGQEPFTGHLDNIQFYRTALSEAAAGWLYNHPGEAYADPEADPELKVFLTFSEGLASVTTTEDQSGNDHDGELGGTSHTSGRIPIWSWIGREESQA